ncbi:hypothetical protein D3C80_1219330 [compost metagenome]
MRPNSVCLASVRSNFCWLGLKVTRSLTPSSLVEYWPYRLSSSLTANTSPARQLPPLRLRSVRVSLTRLLRSMWFWSRRMPVTSDQRSDSWVRFSANRAKVRVVLSVCGRVGLALWK